MIDVISTQELQRLAAVRDPHCVSMYLPTHPGGPDTQQDPIRFKNLLAAARHELVELGLRRPDIEERLAPAEALQHDSSFWASQAHGLAVFLAGEQMSTYRLAVAVPELAVVTEGLHLEPLWPSVDSDEQFLVLALSQNQVRLLRGVRHALVEEPLGAIPGSLAEALRYDDREPQLQSHGGNRIGGGSVVAAFHGQGGGKDSKVVDVERFLGMVDAGLRATVDGTSVPLVLAGVDDIVSRFSKLSRYPRVVDGHVVGNPELLSPQELHERAWPLVAPIFDEARQQAGAAFEAGAVPRLDVLADTVVAAHGGRVDTLFVPAGVQRWGTFDADAQTAVEHEAREPGDRDLLDAAAIDTLVHGGRVFVVPEAEMPGDGLVAAILRY